MDYLVIPAVGEYDRGQLLREKPTVAEAQPLFSGVPVFGPPDELFACHGWLRGPVTLRQVNQPADPHRPTNFLINLRALFGMQARAEVMASLLAKGRGIRARWPSGSRISLGPSKRH